MNSGSWDPAAVAEVFRTARGFASSPLYSHLLAVVADDDALLDLAARTRHGQQPTFALFGAVHFVLLKSVNEHGGTDDPLAAYYVSIAGAAARPVDGAAGPAFARFCATHHDELATILRTRLVQTNHVQRATVLRLGLALMRRLTEEPVCMIEIGCSAGLNLRADRYAFALPHTTFGDPASPVRIRVDISPTDLLPDLDDRPTIAAAVGVDLAPLDVTRADDRAWLRALVWPENTHQAAYLDAATAVVAADPPRLVRGDVGVIGPAVAASLPAGLPRLLAHTATRIHVPPEDRPAFDAGVAAFGTTEPMLRLALEDDQCTAPSGRPGIGLVATDRAGSRTIAVADGHLEWLELLPTITDVRL